MKGAEETIVRVVREAAAAGRELTAGQVEAALNRYIYDETRKRPVIEVVVV